jgi:hypothetical protein
VGSSGVDAAGVDAACDLGASLDEREWVVERCFRASDGRTMAICEGMEEFSIITRASFGCRFLPSLVDARGLGLLDLVLSLCARDTTGDTCLDINRWYSCRSTPMVCMRACSDKSVRDW